MVTFHVFLDSGCMHILVRLDQIENVSLVIPSSPGFLELRRGLYPILHHPTEQVSADHKSAH